MVKELWVGVSAGGGGRKTFTNKTQGRPQAACAPAEATTVWPGLVVSLQAVGADKEGLGGGGGWGVSVFLSTPRAPGAEAQAWAQGDGPLRPSLQR